MHRFGSSWSLGITTLAPFIAAAVAESDDADVASSRLSMAVAALLVLAAVIAVSTIVFWRMTKPDSLNVGEVGIRWIQPEQTTGKPASGDSETAAVSPTAPDQRPQQPNPRPQQPQQPSDAQRARPKPLDTQQAARRQTDPELPARVPPSGPTQSKGRVTPTGDRPMVSPDPVDG